MASGVAARGCRGGIQPQTVDRQVCVFFGARFWRKGSLGDRRNGLLRFSVNLVPYRALTMVRNNTPTGFLTFRFKSQWMFRKVAARSLLLATLLASTPDRALAQLAYAVSPVPSHFGLLDLSTGEFSPIGPTQTSRFGGIATLGESILVTNETGQLLSIEPSTGITTNRGPTRLSDPLFAGSLEGSLYATAYPNPYLYSLNPVTGASTRIGPTKLPPIPFTNQNSASALAAGSDTIFFTHNDDSHASTLYTIDAATGLATEVGPTAPAHQILGLGYLNNTLYAFTGPQDPQGKSIYTLDTATGAPTFVTHTPLVFWGAASLLAGDVDVDGQLRVQDIDAIANAVRAGSTSLLFDMNHDGRVNASDVQYWVHDLKHRWFGDADLDGSFGSGDLVQVFQAGQYEDAIQDNSSWGTGDWDADGDFTSGDLVVAFQDGGYEQGPRAVINAVPEPTSFMMLMISTLGTAVIPRTRRKPI